MGSCYRLRGKTGRAPAPHSERPRLQPRARASRLRSRGLLTAMVCPSPMNSAAGASTAAASCHRRRTGAWWCSLTANNGRSSGRLQALFRMSCGPSDCSAVVYTAPANCRPAGRHATGRRCWAILAALAPRHDIGCRCRLRRCSAGLLWKSRQVARAGAEDWKECGDEPVLRWAGNSEWSAEG